MSRSDRFFFRTFVPRSARRADRVLTGSEWTKRDLVERYGVAAERIVVTHYGFDPVFTPEGPRREGRAVRAVRRRAAAAQGTRARSARGVGVDSTPHPRLRRPRPRARGRAPRAGDSALGLAERVEFAGHVPRDELAALYRGCSRARLPLPLRGLRPAGARGDGVWHAGRGDGGRRPSPRSPATPPSSSNRTPRRSRPGSSARSPSASGSPRPDSSAPRGSAGPRPPAGRPRSTGSSL